jgi:hypothetical protein
MAHRHLDCRMSHELRDSRDIDFGHVSGDLKSPPKIVMRGRVGCAII